MARISQAATLNLLEFNDTTGTLIVQLPTDNANNIQEWKNSLGTNIALLSSVGSLRLGGRLSVGNTGNDFGLISVAIQSADAIGTVIRGAASQTANLQEWQNSSGTVVAFMRGDGLFSSYWGYHTYIQPQSGAGSFMHLTNNGIRIEGYTNVTNTVFSVKGMSGQTGNLQEWQNSAATVVGYIRNDGFGNLNGLDVNYVNGLALSAWGDPYAFSVKRSSLFDAGQPTITPIIVKGRTSQSADLTQWRNTSDTVLAKVSSAGQITSNIQSSSAVSTPIVLQNSATGVGTGTALLMNYGGVDYVSIESAYATSPGTGGAYLAFKTNIVGGAGSLANRLLINNNGTVTINGFVDGAQGLIVKGAASQTANLQEWQNSAGTVKASVRHDGMIAAQEVRTINNFVMLREENSGGYVNLVKAAATNNNPGANQAKLYFRDGTNAGTLKLVVRAGAAGAETTILDNIPQS